jgi:aryl-alcohol dehydrogenase-like predicted oxidoreductase
MEHIQIEGLPMQASRIGLGTWAIGGWMWGGTEESEAIGTIHAALDGGINLIDTAPVYGFGRSEELVGKALGGGRREQAIIATKVGLDWESGKILRNSSPARLRQELENSLRHLKTEVIDIYQVHWPDESVPFEETARTLDSFKREGKIRAIGVSNFSPAQMDRFRKAAPLATIQPPYNLFEREIEKNVLPYAKRNGFVVLAYGALCRGLLSGKITAKTRFEGDDLRKVDPKFRQPRLGHYLEAVARLDRFARERYGKSVLALAVRWLLDQGEIIALWGARRPDQLVAVRDAMGWQLDASAIQDIDRILNDTVKDRVGPEFMAPPPSLAASAETARAATRC